MRISEAKINTDSLVATVLRVRAGQYELFDRATGFRDTATVRGILRKRGHSPLAGDLVYYESSGDPDIPWVINEVCPRRNFLVRPPLANLDYLVIVLAVTQPKIDYHLADRLLSYACARQIKPILFLSKMDEIDHTDPQYLRFYENYRQSGFPIYESGFGNDTALIELKKAIAGQTVAFTGQSGAGKSTLLNRLFDLKMSEVGVLSEKLGRGKQTTRHSELFPVEDGYIADTPGFSNLDPCELGLSGAEFELGYPEIVALKPYCRFNNCRHLGESGCAVAEATDISPERLARYREFRKLLDAYSPY